MHPAFPAESGQSALPAVQSQNLMFLWLAHLDSSIVKGKDILVSIPLLSHGISAPLAHAYIMAPAGAVDGKYGGAAGAATAAGLGLADLAAAINEIGAVSQSSGVAAAINFFGIGVKTGPIAAVFFFVHFDTRFNNAVSFIPSVKQILPYEKKEGKQIDLIFDPDVKTVLDELIRMSTESVAYSLYLETKISEQASRRMAMQNANDNADELEQELVLAYNQARQAAITQEITEIIAGADAL